MRRQVPLAICFVVGVIMIITFFIRHPVSTAISRGIYDWLIIVFAFALVLGTGSLIRLHVGKIRRKSRDWQFSIVAMTGLVVMLLAGLITGMEQGSFFMRLFEHVQIPLQSTMFSILAFYVASAAYRAFRARSLSASLLLLAAILVMLGRVPVGNYIWSGMGSFTEWILDFPNMAAKRGIMIGVGFGMISTALKIILGIERSYIGGGK
jgi:hypothetical protein